jgi:tetratricopeptide (TPR) repeat protein
MSDNNNIQILAETAYESKNYEQAYGYYSKLLESDPASVDFWIGKGLSAGWTSSPQNQKLDELLVCLRQAVKKWSFAE